MMKTSTETRNALHLQRLTGEVKVSLVIDRPSAEPVKERKEIKIFEIEMERINQAFAFMSNFRAFLEGSLKNME